MKIIHSNVTESWMTESRDKGRKKNRTKRERGKGNFKKGNNNSNKKKTIVNMRTKNFICTFLG